MAHSQVKGVATSWTRKILFQIRNIHIKLFKALSPPRAIKKLMHACEVSVRLSHG